MTVRMIVPERQEYEALAADFDLVPVFRELLADTETPVSVLQRFADRENVFLLESMEGGETWGRYSFLGVDPELILDCPHGAGRSGTLDSLRAAYAGLRVAEVPGLPRRLPVRTPGLGGPGKMSRRRTPPAPLHPAGAPPRL